MKLFLVGLLGVFIQPAFPVKHHVELHEPVAPKTEEVREFPIYDTIEALPKPKPMKVVEDTAPKETQRVEAVGSCEDWIRQAGIEEVSTALQLIGRESGCNPAAVNKSSGACGIPQALPCSKLPGFPNDPVAQLRWMDSYVKGRYGSWSAALNHSHSKGWY